MTDEWKCAILLTGLSGKFGPFITGLEAKDANITADKIISKLLDCNLSEKGKALFANKTKKFKEKKCYNCSSPDHLSNKCDKPK